MADASYQPAVYRKQGGTGLVITTGGTLELWGTDLTVTGAELNLTDNQPASVTWVLSATGSTATKDISATVTDAAGTAMAGNQLIKLYLFADAGPAAYLTPTSGMAMTTGPLAATCDLVVGSSAAPQYSMYAITSTAGVLSLHWTDTGKTATYIGAVLPGGRVNVCTSPITTT